ncbi:MAG: helicase-related protein [Candidatus Eremiobacterota bacterium]
MEKLYSLLCRNHFVQNLSGFFKTPVLWSRVIPHMKLLNGRKEKTDREIVSEILSYLTLGAISQKDGEPLLRPKIHYFIQGLQGIYISFDDKGPHIFFDEISARENSPSIYYPLLLCRNCGQHYIFGSISKEIASGNGSYMEFRSGDYEQGEEEKIYLTDILHTQLEEIKGQENFYQCSFCGSLHREDYGECLNEKCRVKTGLIKLLGFKENLDSCNACRRGNTVVQTLSQEVYDVMILAQSMLSSMNEKVLQKLLVFADNRQDAAFQAGWMESRSLRFRLRHLLYQLLHEKPEKVWDFYKLSEEILLRAQQEKLIKRFSWDNEVQLKSVTWFMLEEFASPRRIRTKLEQLAMAGVFYDHLDKDRDELFLDKWSKILNTGKESLVNIIKSILDYYRLRQNLSHPLLQRLWQNTDQEVFKGLITITQHSHPSVIVLEKPSKSNSILMGWIASNGRSGPQVMMTKAINNITAKTRDDFLKELWEWLSDKKLLVNAQLIKKRYGKIEKMDIPANSKQINIEKIGIREIDSNMMCGTCRKAALPELPSKSCPGYTCKGFVEKRGRDKEHFDVVQYTEMSFVPLRPYEHSAQINKEERERIEKEFKKEDTSEINCIVCTPTLELGVDIGKLEMVLMKNVPPTPANYAQRAGRAGRKHRIAVIFAYCRGSEHDRYFFNNPSEMISGAIRVPAFSMKNEPLIRKHIHSMALTVLRGLCNEEEKLILKKTFPQYIMDYLCETFEEDGQERTRYRTHPQDISEFKELISKYREKILKRLKSVFTDNWPETDREAVDNSNLENYLSTMTENLQSHINRLFYEVNAYRDVIKEYNRKETEGIKLTDEEKGDKRRFQNALDNYSKKKQDNYSLSYLSTDGYFPGYTMNRSSISAQCLEPFLEVSRPASVALRELTSANMVYANRVEFQVKKVNFYRFKADNPDFKFEQLKTSMILDQENKRIIDPKIARTEGGIKEEIKIDSYQLIDVELKKVDEINDSRDTRRRVAFNIYPLIIGEHHGGELGKIGDLTYKFLKKEKFRLINTGPRGKSQAPQGVGFPICPKCGNMRSPFASATEIEDFSKRHKQTCKIDTIDWASFHVEITSDMLLIGPFAEEGDAVNILESVEIGSRMVLDMGDSEVESYLLNESKGKSWIILFDPIPGGTGFLPQICRNWKLIAERSIEALGSCNCIKACYRCMKRFRNQSYHQLLDREKAVNLMSELIVDFEKQHDIPPVYTEKTIVIDSADSPAEVDFIKILQKKNFPVPGESQYKVELGGGSFTVADFAYPDEKILIFIDGLSKKIHGNPEQRRKDTLLRAKAELKGFHVVEISKQGLEDEEILSLILDKISIYLNKE